MIITKTPFRLSLFGGGTDYREWFQAKGGMVLAASMRRYCYISVRKLPPFFEHQSRIVYSLIENVKSVKEIQHPSARACLEHLNLQEGIEIHHDGDLPARSGIGSSSSFTVGLLNALHALRYEMKSKYELASEAIHVEQNLIGETVGIQDQIMAAFGGIQKIEMGPGPNFVVAPLILPPDYLKAFEDHILLGFTGVSRTAHTYATSQLENMQNQKTASELSEISGIAREALAILIQNGNLEGIGKLFDLNWTLKKKLAKGLSNAMIDGYYEQAKKAGAFGGKLMGAGGGGFMLFFAPPYRHQAIKDTLNGIKVWVSFQLDRMGSQVILHDES